MPDEPSFSPEPAAPLYGRVALRLRALVIDTAIIAAFAVAVVITIDVVESEAVGRVLIPLLLLSVLLYDPVMVAAWGGTLGHRAVNLRVADGRAGGRIGIGRALVRFVLKTVLGFLSFFFMAITRRHQALHDLAARTVVVIHDPSRAGPADYAVEAEFFAPPSTVSAARRVVAIIGYSIAFVVAGMLLSASLLSEPCALENICTAAENAFLNASVLLLIAGVGVLLVLGWRGRLPGARTRQLPPETPAEPRPAPPTEA